MGQWSRVFVDKLGPGFEPPYDSPIEETFAWNAIKYVRPDTSLHKQYDISTKRGGFRLDFVLERNGRRVAFECDGKEFHDAYRDEWRDAITLGEGHVEVVYRLRGRDIHFHISEILYVVAHWESDLFTEAGRLNLSSLNYSSALELSVEAGPTSRLLQFVCDGDQETHGHDYGYQCRHIDMERRTKHDRVMQRHYARSLALGPGDLDATIARAAVVDV